MEHDHSDVMQFDKADLISAQAARQVGGFGQPIPPQKAVAEILHKKEQRG